MPRIIKKFNLLTERDKIIPFREKMRGHFLGPIFFVLVTICDLVVQKFRLRFNFNCKDRFYF